MRTVWTAVMALLVSSAMFGQAKSAKLGPPTTKIASDKDQLGMTCAQILEISSMDWVAQFKTKTTDAGSEQDKTLRAVTAYGKCYDARTDRIASALGRRGAGPMMGGRAAFRDFEQSLQKFETQALGVSDPPADQVKKAYAGLYEKQFRYDFFKAPEDATAKPASAKPASGVKPATTQPASAQADAKASAKSADASGNGGSSAYHCGSVCPCGLTIGRSFTVA